MHSFSRFCLLFFSFYFFTAARGQLISLSVKNESLEKVFLLVEQQSDYKFIYSTEQINLSHLRITRGEFYMQMRDKCIV